MQIQENPTKVAHNIWRSVLPVEHDVRKAEIKARVITGTYILQTNTAQYNKVKVSPTCLMCGNGDETLQHFLLDCEQLEGTRKIGINMLSEIIEEIHPLGLSLFNTREDLTQFIMDCAHKTLEVSYNYPYDYNSV
ncbi:hypothetical protein DPMN_046154 [Dreissena polymorpha]|uniref:Reverse transcriptase n=1 Tax=Dreissena polymorpha TaxID=45954 RepID=A0A9D4D689_DREPO|nr:hypothetical protein DPMN_046154 [Dreissena polymorpha]